MMACTAVSHPSDANGALPAEMRAADQLRCWWGCCDSGEGTYLRDLELGVQTAQFHRLRPLASRHGQCAWMASPNLPLSEILQHAVTRVPITLQPSTLVSRCCVQRAWMIWRADDHANTSCSPSRKSCRVGEKAKVGLSKIRQILQILLGNRTLVLFPGLR